MKDTQPDSDDAKSGDPALVSRTKPFLQSKVVHLDRYLLNQVEIGMKFYQSKPAFYLMTDVIDANFRIDIVDMVLNVCKVQLNPAIIYAQNKILEKTQYILTQPPK